MQLNQGANRRNCLGGLMIFNWFFLGYECRGKLFGHLENISVDYPRWSVLCHLTLDTFLECLWLRDTKS